VKKAQQHSKTKKDQVLVLYLDNPAKPNLLDEFIELIKSADKEIVDTLSQSRYPTSAHFFGKGFLERLQEEFEAHKYDTISAVIVSSELTPLQYFNIQAFIPENVLLIDKFQLVLTIFENRASSLEAKLQIELARLQYNVIFEKNWYLAKMIGGNFESTGGTERRGFGQSGELKFDEIVADHRKKEAILKKKLEKIKQDRKVRRKGRLSTDDILNFSLVGYTNAGKSTIINSLTNSHVLTENKLFTTLGTTTRSLKFFDLPIMITDTVGFLEDLPTRLIDAFRSTLEESLVGDIIVVLDASDPISEIERKLDVTISILKEIDVETDDLMFLFNKIDKVDKNELIWIDEWFATTNYSLRPRAFVSALNQEFKEFIKILHSITTVKRYQVSFPESFQGLRSELYNQCEILHEKTAFDENTNLNYSVIDLRTRRSAIFKKLLAKIESESEKTGLKPVVCLEVSTV
jgi:GTP-binding protein HflX